MKDDAEVKNLTANAGNSGDAGSIPGLGRSPGGGNGNPLQYSCLENSIDRGAWQATVHGVTKSRWSPQSMGCKCTMNYSVSNTEESSETNVMNTNIPLTQRIFLKTKHGRYS